MADVDVTSGLIIKPVKLPGSEAAPGGAPPAKALYIAGYEPSSGYLRSVGIMAVPFSSNGIADSSRYGVPVMAFMAAHNGSTSDKWYNNIEGVAAYSAARTVSGTSSDLPIYNGARLAVFLDVTAVSGTTPTLDVVVTAKDPASGKYFAIGTFAQKTGVASEAIFIGGGADTKFPTRTWRIEFTIGGTTPSFTFSVGYAVAVQ